ncbi:MAG: acyl-CoA thioesterase domain-containing protein [Pseudomonadota bacterium]
MTKRPMAGDDSADTEAGPTLSVPPGSPAAKLFDIPFMQATGLQCLTCDPVRSVFRLEPQNWVRAAEPGRFDPGALTAIIDQLSSSAIWGRYGPELPHATISLNAEFLARLDLKTLRFESQIAAEGDGLAHIALEVRCEDTDALLAKASAMFFLGSYASGAKGRDASDFANLGPSSAQNFENYLGVEEQGGTAILPFRPRLVGSLDPMALHGGAIAAGLIHGAHLALPKDSTHTLKRVTIEYLKGAHPADTSYTGHIVNAGRSSTVVSVEGRQGETRLIATALARFADFSNN